MSENDFDILSAEDAKLVKRQNTERIVNKRAWAEAVRNGKTVRIRSRVPTSFSGSRYNFRQEGYRLHAITDGEGGTILWADKIREDD